MAVKKINTMIMIVGFMFAFVLFGVVAYMVYDGILALLNVDMDQDSEEDIIFGYDHRWNKHE